MSFRVPESNLGKFLVTGSTAAFLYSLIKFSQGQYPLSIFLSGSAFCAFQWRQYVFRHPNEKNWGELAIVTSVAFLYSLVKFSRGQLPVIFPLLAGVLSIHLWQRWAHHRPLTEENNQNRLGLRR